MFGRVNGIHGLGVCGCVALLALGCGESTEDDGVNAGAIDAGSNLGPDAGPVASVWQWVDVPGTECMDDSATGMGININPDSDKLMIYLEGGGACFNAFTCGAVAHQNGFGPADLEALAGSARGIFDRTDPDNPVARWNWVFIPYCTGDIFAGNNPDGFGGRNQVGYRNMGFYVDELVARWGNAKQVLLTGSSAGGFGAAYNYDRVQQAFADVPVVLLDDSGPPMSDKYMTPCLQQQTRELWKLNDTLPADCSECRGEDGGGLYKMSTYIAEKYPNRNLGLIASTTDGVIRLFYGWGYPTCDNPMVPMPEEPFRDGLAELRDVVLKDYDNFSVYTIDSGLHVWLLEEPLGQTEVSGVKITDWIRALLADDGGPEDVIP